MLNRFVAGTVRDRQPGIGSFKLMQFGLVKAFVRWVGLEVDLGLDQRDQVIQYRDGQIMGRQLANTRHRIVAIAIKQAGNQQNVWLQTRQKRFTEQFGYLAALMITLHTGPDGARREPDTDIFLRQQALQRGTDRFDGFGKHTIQRHHDVVLATMAQDRLCQRQAVTTNSAKPAFALRTLQINHDTHYWCSLPCSIAAFNSL